MHADQLFPISSLVIGLDWNRPEKYKSRAVKLDDLSGQGKRLPILSHADWEMHWIAVELLESVFEMYIVQRWKLVVLKRDTMHGKTDLS